MENSEAFQQILHRERELRGWSQEELAARIKVAAKTVRRWESGKSFPRPYARQELSKVLGKSIPELGLVSNKAVDVNVIPASDDKQKSELPTSGDKQETEIPTSQASYRQAKTQERVICTYDAHASWVLAVDWKPGGEHIASAGGDGVVRIWDANSTETLKTYRGHAWLSQKMNWPPVIHRLAWSPDGTRVASASNDKTVQVWYAI